MPDDCIAVTLGLPQLKILEQKESDRCFEVIVSYRREEAGCPRCGQATSKEHDRRRQWKQDRRLRDKVVYLGLIKRRFRCPFCGKVFTESDEFFGPPETVKLPLPGIPGAGSTPPNSEEGYLARTGRGRAGKEKCC